ncbi:hypothetical protein evm_009423 [Chilo suppressalis]|nr:hypothetical protein evm_009423 [Chilo suppressalis]
MAIPLPLQLANPVGYVDNSGSLSDYFSGAIFQRNAEHSPFHSALSVFEPVDQPHRQCPRLGSVTNKSSMVKTSRYFFLPGCYLVRLYHLGAWRCVWVNDQVPVDANDSPLLPFSPLMTNTPATTVAVVPSKSSAKTTVVTAITSPVVHLWPLLICKALLKLAAPDMNSDEQQDSVEDELMPEFNIMHSLTGSVSLTYQIYDYEALWKLITSEVPVFTWEDDDDTLTSTVKSKSTKKSTAKETTVARSSLATILIRDTKDLPPYALPGITPAHEMTLAVNMARDLPLKKPLPEPDVAMWKHYRWIDWARQHGLYEAYDCPNTRFLKVNGLLKLSHAPHLLDVQSTESIIAGYREEHEKTATFKKGTPKDATRSTVGNASTVSPAKEELREWVQYDALYSMVKNYSVLYYPSMYQFTSAGSNPPIRITKGLSNKPVDIVAPKCAPFYLQIDGPEESTLRISLNVLHPRIISNSGVPFIDYIEPAYLILEKFEWFVDSHLPMAKAYVQTRGYDSVEVTFEPGRHICRLWVHSRMNWHIMLLSESTLLLGTKDIVQAAAVKECPWAAKFLTHLGVSFTSWSRMNRSNLNVLAADREFYRSYQPDLTWDQNKTGYNKSFLHWMFRQALKSLLSKRLMPNDYRNVCGVLRRYFSDPDFGFPNKPKPQKSLREIANMDPCDCVMPEAEEMEADEEVIEEQVYEEKPLVDEDMMALLLRDPKDPITSQVCELATEELPCGILKEERDKVVRKHEAATLLQAHWRGTWARKCLRSHVTFTPEITKIIMENAFGNLDALSALMNEFFAMYPTTKSAYSIASALTGMYGLRQFSGSSPITASYKWIPFFQGVFYCHEQVKVHFDLQSSIQHCTVAVYDNDTGLQKPQVFNAHITFDFSPNNFGYTVIGHGSLNQPTNVHAESHWQLTVLSSISESFHLCDNDPEGCKEQHLPHSHKLHIDEMFLPNRRNILGGIQISVVKNEVACFRAAATSPDLEMEVKLQTMIKGQKREIATCCGKGEVFWPYIKLEPAESPEPKANKDWHSHRTSTKILKSPQNKTLSGSGKSKSTTKLKISVPEPKLYYIEVTAPQGWPLTLAQWRRVDEIRNSLDFIKIDIGQHKKPAKDKPASAKSKDKDKELTVSAQQPQPEDAYVVLECALAIGGGAYAKRDEDRDLELAAAIKSWDAKEPGRNLRGAQIRKEFRAEFLEVAPVPPSESERTLLEETLLEEFGEELIKGTPQLQQGPTPASESGIMEMSVESEEEAKYILLPEQLKDKFIPLYFVPLCMKEKDDDLCVLLTSDIAEAAIQGRQARTEAGLNRMKELQAYNEDYVLGKQRRRSYLLEKLFVDNQWNEELIQALEARDEAIATETLNRTVSATKRKQETKKK